MMTSGYGNNLLDGQQEELREIEVAAAGEFFGSIVKVRQGKRTLVFTSKRGDSITFDRRKGLVKVTAKHLIIEVKICNMNHGHETGRKLEEYESFGLSDELCEMLADWLRQ